MTGADFIKEQTGWRCPYCQRIFQFSNFPEKPQKCSYCGYDPSKLRTEQQKKGAQGLIWALEETAKYMETMNIKILLLSDLKKEITVLRYIERLGDKEIKVKLEE